MQPGLGRGLAALIPGPEQGECRGLSGRDRLVHRVANAAFDLLEDTAALGLCTYLHAPHDGEPRLWLRRPGLDTLTSTRAFRLFHRVAQASNAPATAGCLEWEGLSAVHVRTLGPASDGLFVAGPLSGSFDRADRRRVETICRAFGHLAHQVQTRRLDGSPPCTTRSALTIDLRAGTVLRLDDRRA